MKKVLIILAVCLSLSTLGFSEGVFLRLSGGASLVLGGNYDKALKGQNDYYQTLSSLSITGELGKPRAAIQFAARLEYDPVDYVGISIGLGYHNISSSSKITLTGTGESIADEYTSLVRAVSVGASIHLYIPVTPELRLAASAGPEVYFSSLNLDHVFGQQTTTTSYTLTFDSETKAVAGLRATLGLDISFAESVSGFIQAVYTSAVFTVPQGTFTLSGVSGSTHLDDSGTTSLWYSEVNKGGTFFPALTVAASQPSDADHRNVGAASIGFGGAGLEVGLKIGF